MILSQLFRRKSNWQTVLSLSKGSPLLARWHNLR